VIRPSSGRALLGEVAISSIVHAERSTTMLIPKNLLFTLIVPGTVAVYVPLLLAQDRPTASGTLLLLAILLLGIGGAIYAWCVWDFAVLGRGTPAPIDAPRRLAVRGLYRCVRNPMYVGVLTVILGWATLFHEGHVLLYAICVGFCFHLFVIFYEERRLARQFGAEYHEYCANVDRWLPRFH
jgi:protein-S-isoprenylcysteine O-methyltransferase Ste14